MGRPANPSREEDHSVKNDQKRSRAIRRVGAVTENIAGGRPKAAARARGVENRIAGGIRLCERRQAGGIRPAISNHAAVSKAGAKKVSSVTAGNDRAAVGRQCLDGLKDQPADIDRGNRCQRRGYHAAEKQADGRVLPSRAEYIQRLADEGCPLLTPLTWRLVEACLMTAATLSRKAALTLPIGLVEAKSDALSNSTRLYSSRMIPYGKDRPALRRIRYYPSA